MKVICAGAPKTGTKSMAAALRILGYNEVYDIEEAIEYGFERWEDLFNGKVQDLTQLIDHVYDKGVEAVVDLPHAYFFDQFLEKWPKAKVILTIREIEDWYESYKAMVEKAINKYFFLHALYYLSPSARRLLDWCWGMSKSTIGTVEPREILWKSWYKRHNSYVKCTVPPSQLLIFNVEEGWEPLCKFLEKEIPDTSFPCENKSNCKHNITDKMLQDTWIAQNMIKEIKIIGSLIILLFVACICFLWYYVLI